MSPRVNLDKDTILKAASELADEEGLNGVTMLTLAKKLNIKSPSLYNHFNSMNDVKIQLAVYGTELLYSSMVQATIGISGDDVVHSLAQAYVGFVRKHNGLYDAITQIPMQSSTELQAAGDKTLELLSRVLYSYHLKKEEEIHVVRGLRSMLHGFASIEKNGGFGIPLSTDASLQKMVDTYLTGMHALKNEE